MRKFRLLLLVLILAVPALAQATKTYESQYLRMQYPADWGMVESERSALTRFYTPADADPSGNLKEFIDIEVGKVSDNMSMDMFSFSQKHDVEQNYPGLKLKQSKETRMGKLKGHRFDYQGTHQGREMTLIQVFAIAGLQSYVMTYIGETAEYKRHSNWFETSVRSFVAR